MAQRSVDLVVIGGGIMGLAVAYQVARRSSLSVVVLEKGAGLGEGSTGASAAITRQRYTHPEQIRLARDGNIAFRSWAEYTGLENPRARYHRSGVLWIMGDDQEHLESDAARMQAEAVDAVVIGPDEFRSRFPGLSLCVEPFDLSGAVDHVCREGRGFLLEQDSGFFDATEALWDLADAARHVGVDVRFGVEVVDVEVRSGRALGVVAADGSRIAVGTVVNAAGPWCNRINTMAGLEHRWDLVPTRVQVVYRDLAPEVPRPIPVVGDGSTGVYFRPESADQQIMMGSILEEDEQETADPDEYPRIADRSFVDTKIHALHHRIPALPHRGGIGGMAGLYTINHQDVHPVVGPTAIDGYLVMNGFSGHGFKESQMFGSMIARYLTGETAAFDTEVAMAFYSIDRAPLRLADKNVLA